MNIKGWITGMVVFAMVFIMFTITEPIITGLETFAQGSDIDPNAFSVINFVRLVYDYAVVISAGGAILYILYSNMRFEAETRYRY